MKTTVLIPTYNETGNIAELINKILVLYPDYDVLVVDDNSPDGTAELIRTNFINQRQNNRVKLIVRTQNRGRGLAGIEGYKQAIRLKPNDAETHFSLGRTYYILGHNTEALEEYKQTIRLKPNFAMAHSLLGVIYLDTNNRAKALDEYKILKDLDKDLADKLFNLIYK